MYVIETRGSFDSAHFLSGYEGSCSNIHGHRWNVHVEVYSKDVINEGSKRGMVIDFGDIKEYLKSMLKRFDHTLIYEKGTLKKGTLKAFKEECFSLVEVEYRPTAENLAKYFFDELENEGFNIKSLSVYETPNNIAKYIKNDV